MNAQLSEVIGNRAANNSAANNKYFGTRGKRHKSHTCPNLLEVPHGEVRCLWQSRYHYTLVAAYFRRPRLRGKLSGAPTLHVLEII